VYVCSLKRAQECKTPKEQFRFVERKGAYHDVLHDQPYADDNRKEIVGFCLARIGAAGARAAPRDDLKNA